MQWLPVVGYEGQYEVSACGAVRRCARSMTRSNGIAYGVAPKTLAQVAYGHRRCYLGVGLRAAAGSKSLQLVHRLVAQAFVPNPDQLPEVNHKNLNKHDNRAENLEWCSSAANHAHAAARGRFHGATNPNVRFKLQPCDVDSIRADLLAGRYQWQIAERHGVSQSMVSQIKNGHTWAEPPETPSP